MPLNEEKILSGKFIFVSYSHRDQEAVATDVEALLARGVRVWFDVHMRLGDDWTEIAKQKIAHENCVGVLFYNSANAFVSEAVQQEQEMTRRGVEEGRLAYWSVHLGAKTTTEIITEAVTMPKSAEKQVHYVQEMPKQLGMFHERILCLMRTDAATTAERLYQEIAVPYPAVDNEENFMDGMQKNRMASADTDEITIGRYVDNAYIGPEQAGSGEDQRFGSADNLIQLGGRRYTTRPLHWKLLYVKDGRAVLLCTDVLTQTTFGEGELFLKNLFGSIAFSQEEKQRFSLCEPRYLRGEDIDLCREAHKEAALQLARPGKLVHWWIDEDGLTENWKQTYSNGYHYAKGFSVFTKKGLRPVLEIPAANFR